MNKWAGVTVFVGFNSQWRHNDRNNNHKHRYDAFILNWSIEKNCWQLTTLMIDRIFITEKFIDPLYDYVCDKPVPGVQIEESDAK